MSGRLDGRGSRWYYRFRRFRPASLDFRARHGTLPPPGREHRRETETMLTCRYREKTLFVDSFPDLGHLRRLGRAGELACPECGRPVILRHGLIRRPHFAHRPGYAGGCHRAGESVEHLEAKRFLYHFLDEVYPGRVSVEVNLSGGLRPDVLLDLGGDLFPFEIQFSAMDDAAWRERNHAYRRMGLHPVWLIGRREPLPEPCRASLPCSIRFRKTEIHGMTPSPLVSRLFGTSKARIVHVIVAERQKDKSIRCTLFLVYAAPLLASLWLGFVVRLFPGGWELKEGRFTAPVENNERVLTEWHRLIRLRSSSAGGADVDKKEEERWRRSIPREVFDVYHRHSHLFLVGDRRVRMGLVTLYAELLHSAPEGTVITMDRALDVLRERGFLGGDDEELHRWSHETALLFWWLERERVLAPVQGEQAWRVVGRLPGEQTGGTQET